jgi:glycine cleavage system aminomethyltransferase T
VMNGRQIGHVTAAVYSPRLQKNIGYVWVPIELAEPGTALTLETEFGDTRDARVEMIPFIDPSKEIPKG